MALLAAVCAAGDFFLGVLGGSVVLFAGILLGFWVAVFSAVFSGRLVFCGGIRLAVRDGFK